MDTRIGDIELTLTAQGGSGVRRFSLTPEQLPALARAIREEGGQLLALWGSDDRHLGRGFGLHSVFLSSQGLVWTQADLPAARPEYPDLAAVFPQADRMQRAACDLLGLRARGAVDDRKWLRHAAWREDEHPLRKDAPTPSTLHPSPPAQVDAYPFIRVDGEGVHEIPVGPIHAGVIEPGHFRFSVVGDKVLKLEERLGYTHKGIEKRFEGMDLLQGGRLAGRVSGDSHTAYAWAYCMAVEAALGLAVPERALWLRALLLEMERVANHLGDLGYLGNDVALSFGFAQFWRLKEEWLRLTHRLFGHRYAFDRVVPGGVTSDLSDADALLDLGQRLRGEVADLKAVYDEHAGVQDRFAHTGRVDPAMAARLGVIGLAGRASAQAWDLRVQFPHPPYDRLEVNMVTDRRGDVLARVEVRFAEVFESLRLIEAIARRLPAGPLQAELPRVDGVCEGLGYVEGWRGPVLVAVRIGADGRLDRVHPHDPSWQNWPALEVGILGNIVPDFPLINKSFNLSYSGHDL